jgi:integrase
VATIRDRNGVYYVDYRVSGRRFRKKVGPSKKIAELALKDIEVKIAKGDLGFAQKDQELGKLFEYYANYSKTNHSPSTQKRYRIIVEHFKDFLKDKYPFVAKISHLGPQLFEGYKSYRFEEDAENKTINMEVTTLRGIFALAKNWGYCKENPTDGVKALKITNPITPRFLSDDECKKLLKNCNEWEYPIFFTFLNTGMRKGELLNLEWSDIDFDRRKVKVRVKDGWTPKTSEREIPINNQLLEVLKGLKEKRDKGPLVFPDEQGGIITSNRLRIRLMSITKQCEFPDVTKLHTLRHTFASHLVMKGVDLPTVSKLMGHTDIDTTMIYSHLADSHVDKAVEKLEF